MSIKITFPIGRLLWGSVYTPETKDFDGNPLTIKTPGPDFGKPTQRYAFGVAIPKGAEKSWWETPWGAEIFKEAAASFTRGEPQRQDFAWKITDGDSTAMKKRGTKPINQLTGYAGNWVLAFSSSFPPKLYQNNGTEQLTTPDFIKTGYYIQVAGTVAGNGNLNNPGVYLNHELVNFSAYGEEIQTGADPLAAGFGGALPAGASAAPLQGSASFAPGGYGPAAAPSAPAAPAAPAMPAPPAMPSAPPAMPAAPAVPSLVQVPGAQYAIEACRAAGWTDDQIVQQGVATRAPAVPSAPAAPASPAMPAPPAMPAAPGVQPVPSFLNGPQ